MITFDDSLLSALRDGLRDCRFDAYLWEMAARGRTARVAGRKLVVNEVFGETALTFDDRGDPSSLRETGRLFDFRCDGAGHIIEVQRGDASLTFERDPSGRVTGVRSGDGLSLHVVYDTHDRVIEIGVAGRTPLEFDYGADGLLHRRRCGDRNRIFRRDETGELRTVASLNGDLDGGACILSHTEGALARVVLPDGGELHYAADPGTGVGVFTRPTGRRIAHRVDGSGHLGRVSWSDRHGDPSSFVALDWQGDELVGARSATSWTTFDWSPVGLVEVEASPTGAVRFGYDERQRLESITGSSGERLVYRYDDEDRLERLDSWGTTIEVCHSGRSERREWASGLVEERRYEGERLAYAQVRKSGVTLSEQHYTYEDGRLVEHEDAGGKAHEGFVEQLGYDGEGRLVTSQDRGAFSTVNHYWHEGPSPRASTTMHVETDNDGFVTRIIDGKRILVVVHADDGMLHETSQGQLAVTYRYDALGRRVEKRSSTGITRFGWAGDRLVFEESVVAGKRTRRDYLYDLSETTTGCPMAFREAGRLYFMQHDARGAVVRVFRSDGALGWRARYDPWGTVSIDVERIRQPFRLRGHYADEETGLHYALGRYYDPKWGAYLSPSFEDPFVDFDHTFAAGDPFTWHDIGGRRTTALAEVRRGHGVTPLGWPVRLDQALRAADREHAAASAVLHTRAHLGTLLSDTTTATSVRAGGLIWRRLARESAMGDALRLLEMQPHPTAIHEIVRRLCKREGTLVGELRHIATHALRWAG